MIALTFELPVKFYSVIGSINHNKDHNYYDDEGVTGNSNNDDDDDTDNYDNADLFDLRASRIILLSHYTDRTDKDAQTI